MDCMYLSTHARVILQPRENEDLHMTTKWILWGPIQRNVTIETDWQLKLIDFLSFPDDHIIWHEMCLVPFALFIVSFRDQSGIWLLQLFFICGIGSSPESRWSLPNVRSIPNCSPLLCSPSFIQKPQLRSRSQIVHRYLMIFDCVIRTYEDPKPIEFCPIQSIVSGWSSSDPGSEQLGRPEDRVVGKLGELSSGSETKCGVHNLRQSLFLIIYADTLITLYICLVNFLVDIHSLLDVMCFEESIHWLAELNHASVPIVSSRIFPVNWTCL